jgi:hypothetical protein
MADFEGKWKLETSDNFENYLRAVGKTLLVAVITTVLFSDIYLV